MLSACTREVTDNISSRTNESTGNDIDEITLIGNLPNDDETTEPKTRTDYDFTTDSQKALFSWKTGDRVVLVIYDKNDGRKHQDMLTFTLSAMSEDKKTATFGGMNGYHKSGFGATWTSAGFAVYPNTIACTNNGASSSYTQSYVKLPSTVTGEKSSVILVGVPNDNENPTNFDFKSAMAILRVTITGIPANAKELRLSTADKTNYPIDGDFYLENNAGTVTIGSSQYQGNGNGYQKVDLSSEGAIASREFLFNIPVGEYPANILKLQLIDDNNLVILEKRVAKNFSFIRNHFISTPSLEPEWELLGNAKFVDNYSFAKAASKAGYMVDVPIYKKVGDLKSYRLANPYDAAWKAFGLTNSGSDAIVSLEVKMSGDVMQCGSNTLSVTNNNLVYFYRGTDPTQLDNKLYTGYKLVSAGSMIVAHPFAKDQSKAESYMLNSKVKKYQESGIPAVITLAPYWDGRGGDNQWLDSATNVIYIIFPGCNPAEAIAGTYNVRENANYQLTIDTNDDPARNVKITRYKGGVYDVSGTCLGNYENGAITFDGGQLFAEKETNIYYFFYMGTSFNANDLELIVDNDVSTILKTGRRLKFTSAGFGLGYGTGLSLENKTATGQQWTTPGDYTIMIKNE